MKLKFFRDSYQREIDYLNKMENIFRQESHEIRELNRELDMQTEVTPQYHYDFLIKFNDMHHKYIHKRKIAYRWYTWMPVIESILLIALISTAVYYFIHHTNFNP